jgi:flagellin
MSNAYDGISAVQVAQSGLAYISNDANLMGQRKVQAVNGPLNDVCRQAVQSEISRQFFRQ